MVTQRLEELGFLVEGYTYHSKASPAFARALAQSFHPGALVLRTRADKCALQPQTGFFFSWEAKTHSSHRQHDACFEALPLVQHVLDLGLDSDCLYVYRRSAADPAVAFWVSQLPPIRTLYIPSRWKEYPLAYRFFRDHLPPYFPGVEVVCPPTAGSGDPFVVVTAEIAQKLPPWEVLIAPYVNPEPDSEPLDPHQSAIIDCL